MHIDPNSKSYPKCLAPGIVSSGRLLYVDFKDEDKEFEFAPLPGLALQMLSLLLTPHLIHIILSRFHQPLFVSQILVSFSQFSATFFLFKLGVQVDPKMLKSFGRGTYILGLGCYFCSLLFGNVLSWWFRNDFFFFEKHLIYKDVLTEETKARFRDSDTIVDMFSLVSFPVIAHVPTDLNILNSDLGHLALHASMVANLVRLVGQACGIWLYLIKKIATGTDADYTYEISVILVMVALFIFLVYIVRPIALWMVKNTPEGKPVKEPYINFMMITVLLCGLATFFLGLAIPDGPPLGTTIVDKLDYMITSFLMPLHMGIAGLKIRLEELELGNVKFIRQAVLVIIGCTFGKIVGVLIPAIFLGVSLQYGFLLGLIMNLKGIVENFYLENTIMVLGMVIIVADITPLVKYLYDPLAKYLTYKRRSILQSKENKSDFRVLVCVHTEDDVPNIIRILEAFNPTKFIPLTVYILHLVELVGRTPPLLVAHPKKRIITSSNTTFTTISPHASMHKDICTMSVDEIISLIIFPFYRIDVITLRDDQARKHNSNRVIKTLLQNLLRNSPCSAPSTSFLPDMSYRFLVIFFGGPDDREALTFARNMIHHPSVFVTVVRFYDPTSLSSDGVVDHYNESVSIDAERHKFLDDELVDHFRINTMHDETLIYKEVEVKDGAETIWAVCSLYQDFDLMVIGRQQITDSKIISGLDTYWAECGELGTLGDIVSSPDYGTEVSILIIHQRQDNS
ncbi:hypothetical protein MKW94_007784 [Papaver nudicaule]|uniref:Cation/H(+) antiporter C-terminal domain-containing protein n=1 Tax=Papaver nudicaule TaxID=74823 RepID=A0AA41W2H2_PAPNU|nr:hypothetical protein [Papaver nudicaule]